MNREEFEGWRKDPVTLWVFAALRKAAEQEKAEWVRQSWDEGKADQSQLSELRTRADALAEVCDHPFETWQEWNGEHVDD